MEMILANANGKEIRTLLENDVDIDLGGSNDFQLTISSGACEQDISFQTRIFIPNTEYGGIIGTQNANTARGAIELSGYTWRGMLNNKIILPDQGQASKVVSGELNSILQDMIYHEYEGIFVIPNISTGIVIENYPFENYCTLLKGLSKMLSSVSHRLSMKYIQQEKGISGYVEIQAVPIVDFSATIEYSQDSQIHFSLMEKRNGTNHMICIESNASDAIHLYVQKDGSIGKAPFYKGIEEITNIFEGNGSLDEVEKNGINKLIEEMNYKKLDFDILDINEDLNIGDIVGGRDYTTGIILKKPIVRKILKIFKGVESIEYKVEGEE